MTTDGGYDGLVKDPNVEIVYIGNVHAFRRSTVEMCLLADKHVLVEKPFACSVADGEYFIGLARERNLFIMEVSTNVCKQKQMIVSTDFSAFLLGVQC